MDHSTIQSLTQGTRGLMFTYGSVEAMFVASLLHRRAPLGRLCWSPVWAALLTILAGIVIGLGHLVVPGLATAGPIVQLGFGLLAAAGIAYAAACLPVRPTSRAGYVRGAVVRRSSGAMTADGLMTLAAVPVAPADETKHFKIIGTTGTGKSTAIRELLGAALARGDRAVIADPDGGFLERYYEPARGDVILNPLQPRSVRWHLHGEILVPPDIDQMARSLIPDHGHSDRVWAEYGRTLFGAVAKRLFLRGNRDDRKLYDCLVGGTVDDLRELLSGSAAAPFLADGNEEFLGSVRSVTTSALRVLEYTAGQQGDPFSVRRWVRDGAAVRGGGRGGVLFIPYKAGEIATLRSIISAWMRMAIFEALDQPEGDQRLWFVVDELDALGEIDGLKDALARLRKFGGRCILGFQSIAQVSGTYGKAAADTIVENCGNTLILRCSASEHGGTSQFASRLIGQREVVRNLRSQTRRPSEWLPTTTSSEQFGVEYAVMASEIERLPDLEGYLKLASTPDWHYVRLAGGG